MYIVTTVVNGIEEIKHYDLWLGAFMDSQDIAQRYRRRSFAVEEAQVSIAIKRSADDCIVATYGTVDGWQFAQTIEEAHSTA